MEIDFHLVFYFLILLLLCQKLQAAESQEAAGKSICGDEICGNVKIPLPFGIKSKCYTDPWFEVICKQTPNGEKPFIRLLDVELMHQYPEGSIIIKNPVTYFNCINKTGVSLNLTNTPFFFQSQYNMFGSVGCGNLASIVGNQNVSLGGCLQPKCGDRMPSESACYVDTIVEDLKSYTANMTVIHPVDKDNRETCTSAFVFSYVDSDNYYPWPLPTSINIETTHVPAVLSWKPVDCRSNDALCRGQYIVPLKSSGKQRCGDVDIQFPFSLNHGDYWHDWFEVTCNETVNGSPKAFINRFDMELLSVSLLEGTARVNHAIPYFNCRKNINGGFSVNLSGSPFYFPFDENFFWSSGCGNLATFFGNQKNHFIGGCLQPSCRNDQNGTSSDGWLGCRMTAPPVLTSYFANMSINIGSGNGNEDKCGFASMVDNKGYFDLITLSSDHRNRTHIPITLQWGTPISGLCELKDGDNSSCSHDDAYCWAWLSSSHVCVCGWNMGYGVTQDVCQEKKCENPKYKYCQMLCLHTPGNYCSSPCPLGYEDIHKNGSCVNKRIRSSGLAEKTRNLVIIIGVSTSIGTIGFLLATFHMYKVLKRTQIAKLKQKYYQRNGGSLLEQHLSSNEGNVEKIKLFTSEEMEKGTDSYNENRVLGQGGQGTVYKGMLMDGNIVAIKKSKMMEGKKFDEKKVKQFINEIIILSQVNHRNVVKLLGCCLEAEIPLLVYEFIPNGTLYDLIHNQNEEFPLTWEMRLRIATEIANAVSYLHSAAYVPIYHRDIKSSNVLLDDKNRAKVSDFGTSRSIALEQTHLTTQVQGTFGYMDPEYFRSSQFTEKSDVYSFGVVLIELLTGQKPVSSQQSEEVRSLISFFLTSMQESSLFDILDPMVANGGPEKEIIAVAKLAKRCLNLNGKRRPTMKQVALELEMIKALEEDNAIEESDDGESDLDDVAESCELDPFYSASMSIGVDCETLPFNASF